MKITRSQLNQLIAEELNVGVPTASMEEEIAHLPSYKEGPRELLDTPHQIVWTWHHSDTGASYFGVYKSDGVSLETETMDELLAFIEAEPDEQVFEWEMRTRDKEGTKRMLNTYRRVMRAFLN